MDYEGNYCGASCSAAAKCQFGDDKTKSCGCTAGDGGIAKKPALFYPRLSQDIVAYTAALVKDTGAQMNDYMYGICAPACPAINAVICDYAIQKEHETEISSAGTDAFYVGAGVCVDWYKSSCFGGLCTGTAPAGPKGIDCKKLGKQCYRNLFAQKSIYSHCLPLSAPDVTYKREICSDPVENRTATWTCAEINTAGGIADVTFEKSVAQQVTDYANCKANFCDTAAVGYTDAKEIRKCLCNPTMCEGSDGSRDATGPQIFLPTTLSDGKGRTVEATSGCNLLNSTQYTFSEKSASKDSVLSAMQTAFEWFSTLISDLIATWPLTLAFGAGISVVLGFLYLAFLWKCAKCVIVTVEIMIILVVLALSCYALVMGGVVPQATLNSIYNVTGTSSATFYLVDDSSYTTTWQVVGWVGLVFAAIVIAVFVYCRKAIQEATAIVEEGCKAVFSLACVLPWPIITTLMQCLAVLYFLISIAFLFSSGAISVGTIVDGASSAVTSGLDNFLPVTELIQGRNVTFNMTVPASVAAMDARLYLSIYSFFGLLWTLQFNLAVLVFIIGGSVTHWYWSDWEDPSPKQKDHPKGRHSILHSVKNTVRYHLGSAAHGSFWIALLQFIIVVVAYIDRKTKEAQGNSKIIKFLMCCLICCLQCFDKMLRYLSRMAFILIAMKGDSFCPSAKAAFTLINANKARFAFTSVFTHFALLMGKILITMLSSAGTYMCIKYYPGFDMDCDPNLAAYKGMSCRKVQQPLIPVIITAICAYFVASAFMYVVEVAIDAILISFSWDCQENDPKRTGSGLHLHDVRAGDESRVGTVVGERT
jgi:hypothetical protein